MITQTYQLKTKYFCAGLFVRENRIVEAAPIIRWAIGKRLSEVKNFYKRNDAFVSCDEVAETQVETVVDYFCD